MNNVEPSFWELSAMVEFDITIIGGGILGLFSALEIRKKYPNSHIAVFESGILPQGATSRNAGFACFGSLTELIANVGSMGEQETYNLVEKRWRGIQKLKRTFKDSEIDYYDLGGYELIFDSKNLEKEISQMNEMLFPIFNKKIFALNNAKIKDFGFNKTNQLIENPLEGQLHSGKLILALHKKLREANISYFSGAELTGYTNLQDCLELEINHQKTFKTQKLILTTNGFVPNSIRNVRPGRGQVLITNPIHDLQIKGCFHFDQGYYYFRNIENRILLGGGRQLDFEGETTSNFGLNDDIQSDLIDKLKTIILPHTEFEIFKQWSGIMAFEENHKTVVQLIDRNVIYAMNCNGMGISLSPITAEELINHISC